MLKSKIFRRSTFLVFGYVVGLLAYIIGMSYITGMKYKNFIDNVPIEYQMSLGIANAKLNDFSNFVNANNQYGINVIKEENDGFEIIGTFLGSQSLYEFDVKGRFIDHNDIINSEKVAVIGRGVSNLCYYKENSKYIKVMDEEFKVIGEIRGTVKTYNQIYVPVGVLIDKYKELSTSNFNFVMMKKNINLNDLVYSIQECLGDNALIYDTNKAFNISEKGMFQISVMILLICSINVINFSYFWIHSRVKEIALRKSVGAKNRDVFTLIFKEMISLTFISLLIAYIVQFVVINAINRITFGEIYLLNSESNFLYSSALCLMLSFITTIPTYLITIKFEPAIILKGE